MTKLVIYRNNSAYEQFLVPALADREGFEMQVFPQGTPETEITAWLAGHADQIRDMGKVFMDQTCYEAGKALPSAKRPDLDWDIWMDVETNYGGFDFQVFHKAATALMTKATIEETIAEVVRHLLAKEVPTKVYVISENMGDHNVFGRDPLVAAKKLRECLSKVTGFPSFDYSDRDDTCPEAETDTVWIFVDRHYEHADSWGWREIPPAFRKFKLPIENLIGDALAFGIEIDVGVYSRAIREIVATW